MEELIKELVDTANALRNVKVDGEFWIIMAASYNSIIQVAQKLQESEVKQNESINNGPDA